MDIDKAVVAPLSADEDLYMGLSVNSLVEVTFARDNAYGIIRWIGTLTDLEQIMAGLELVNPALTC